MTRRRDRENSKPLNVVIVFFHCFFVVTEQPRLFPSFLYIKWNRHRMFIHRLIICFFIFLFPVSISRGSWKVWSLMYPTTVPTFWSFRSRNHFVTCQEAAVAVSFTRRYLHKLLVTSVTDNTRVIWSFPASPWEAGTRKHQKRNTDEELYSRMRRRVCM